MIRVIDKITKVAAGVAAWMIFSIGVMVTYEVVMRKVFNSPTIWVDETARFFQVWAVYLASAHILKRRSLITVELFTGSLSKGTLRMLELMSLFIIAFFSFVALYYGAGVVLESIELGRKTSTMLGVPKYLTESAIPVGFGLLFIQAVVEFFKLVRGDDVAAPAGHQV
ncbi:MAG: TRAP transporter small permease [Deltaproteobacteria bacterium]|nr:TRAP transporter small permease [Deltaproteobacteria bacterium]MBW2659242.1 TRAP transporter small permease [Deltaproteobacteria bacterium]